MHEKHCTAGIWNAVGDVIPAVAVLHVGPIRALLEAV